MVTDAVNVRHVAEILESRWRILRLVPRAGIGLTTLLAALNLMLGVLPVAFVLATSALIGKVPATVSAGVGSPEWDSLVTMFLVAAATFIGQQVLMPVQSALGELVTRRVDGYIHARVIEASFRSVGVAPLEDNALLNDLSEASRELESGFQSPGRACSGLLALIARYVQLAGYVLLIAVIFAWPAAVAIAIATMVFRYGQRGGLRKYSVEMRPLAAARRKSSYLRRLSTEAPAAKEIRVFGLIGWLRGRHRDAYLDWVLRTWSARRRVYLKPYLWFTAVALGCVTLVFVRAGLSTADGSLSLTGLALVMQASFASIRLGDHFPEADVQTQFGTDALAALQRFEEGLTTHPDVRPGPGTVPGPVPAVASVAPDDGPVMIRFQDVAFRYPGGRQVFEHLDLDIGIGRSTAVVGLNGAGKTTLIKLLTGLYQPDAGSITVGSTSLSDLDTDAWRRQIAVIFQNFVHYDATAADNIGFGSVEHLDDRRGILDAARAAGIAEHLEALPDGLDTKLNRQVSGGVDLSGGQWQRIALARALFALRHGASVLVLDEPTASLDVRSEAHFYDEFVRLAGDVTTILISHRFSTVRHADTIIVLEDGRVLEQGTHDDLIRRDGRYAELFHMQAARFADETQDVA